MEVNLRSDLQVSFFCEQGTSNIFLHKHETTVTSDKLIQLINHTATLAILVTQPFNL